MAKPIKHGNKWRIRWRDENGDRKSEVFNTYKEASLALQRRQIEVEEIKCGQRVANSPDRLFTELCQKYLECRAVHKRRQRDDESMIRVHLLPAFGSLKIREIQAEQVDSYKISKSH